MKNKNIKSTDRQWDGFEQILKTPPKPDEPFIKLRDADGVNGSVFIWSETEGRWNFTSVRLQDIPPIEGEPQLRTSIIGRQFTWNQEKKRWWSE